MTPNAATTTAAITTTVYWLLLSACLSWTPAVNGDLHSRNNTSEEASWAGNLTQEQWTGYTGPEYRKEIFPTVPSGEALQVGISVMVRNLPKIDEVEGLVVMEINLRVKWQDTRLRIPPGLADHEYVPLNPVILKHIWVPDLYIDHSEGSYTPSVLTDIASVWIYGDGTVDYSGNMFVRVSCRMNYTWFPRDHQICNVRIESYAYTLDHNVYSWVPPGLEVSDGIPSEQFLVRFEKTEPYTRVQDVYGTYPALAFRLHLTRRLSYMLLQVYLPSGLLVVVSFVSLVVPPEAIPGRMTLCITTILTMCSLLGAAMQSTPQVSYTRAIDVWLLSCLTFVSVVLFEFGLIIKMMEMGKREAATKKLHKEKNMYQVRPFHDPGPPPPPPEDTGGGHIARAQWVDRVALVLLPTLFLVFNFAYWWWFLARSQDAMPDLAKDSPL